MKTAGTIKKGELLIFTADIVDVATSAPAIGLAEDLKCQGRYSPGGILITDFTVSETGTPGTYIFKSGPSDSWLPGLLFIDIRYDTPDGISVHTETFYVVVEEGITK